MTRHRVTLMRGLVMLAALLLITALVGAGVPRKKVRAATARATTTATAATTATATAAATTTHTSPDATPLLEQAAKTMGTINSFHFELTNEKGTTALPDGLKFDAATGDVQRPDRFKAKVDANFKGLPISVTVVGVGSKVWYQNPLTGNYESLSSSEAAVGLLNPAPLLLAAVRQIQHPVVAGQEKINGEQTTRIDGVLNVPAVGNGTPTALPFDTGGKTLPVHIWVDSSGRIVRLQLDGPVRGGESSNVVRQLDLTKFNEQLNIQPPS